ncbi:MAG: hypothetical protein KBD23_02380 [Gammaproteobacteria bacterium]|nr:hypothetical protein [Gammaproteobacteria bacterium]MBP9728972.1 hypothetical protein [Gammaproteobacteria bacterium]
MPLASERGRTFDHVTKVQDTQNGLLDNIENINNRLSYPKLEMIEKSALEQELSKASRLLDRTEEFVPRTSTPSKKPQTHKVTP